MLKTNLDATYLDYNASAPVLDELAENLSQLARSILGSPSSQHSLGRKNRHLINQASEIVSKFIDCDPDFVFWTSGASESNSWAIHSALNHYLQNPQNTQKPVVLISNQEHDSVLLAAKFYSTIAEVELIRTQSSGLVDLDHLEELLNQYKQRVALVSVLYVNNETGVIQPVTEIVKSANKLQVPVHIDCVQALGKIPLSIRSLGARYTTFSGHKLGALKGVGWLTVHGTGKILTPLIHGKQQKTLRGGTENTLAVHSVGVVLKKHLQTKTIYNEDLKQFHQRFEALLKEAIPGTVIHGSNAPRVGNTSFVGFDGIDGDGVLLNLDLEKICASSGSACTSGSLDPSHVLLAMGCDKKLARSSIRFSSGSQTNWSDFERVLKVLPEIVFRVREAQ